MQLPFKANSFRQLAVTTLFLFFSVSILGGAFPSITKAGAVCSDCLTVNKTTFTVGDTLTLNVKNMAPNSPILWTVLINSQPLISSQENGKTDSSGNYTLVSGQTSAGDEGVWTVTVEVGNQQGTVSFTVNPASNDTKPAISYLSMSQAALGETVTFYIEGKNFNGLENQSGNGVGPVSDRGFELVSSQKLSNFEIQVTYKVSTTATLGDRSITVGGSDPQSFTIVATNTPPSTGDAPVISSVNPSSAGFGSKIKINGSNFALGTVYIDFHPAGAGPNTFYSIVDGVTRVSDTEIDFTLDQAGYNAFVPGSYNIDVYIVPDSGDISQESNRVPFTVTGAVSPPPSQGQVVLPPNVSDGDVIQFNNEQLIFLVKADGLYPFENYYSYQLYVGQNAKKLLKVSSPSGNYTVQAMTASQRINLANGDGQPFVPGTLVKDGTTIYLIMVGKAIPFHNMKAFQGLGYSTKNLVNANLSQYDLEHTPGIKSAEVPHTWGSWVSYKGTIYYSDESGLIGVPTYDIFLVNRGMPSLVLPANKYDIAVLNRDPNLPVLDYNDSRVEYNSIGPVPQPQPNPVPVPNEEGDMSSRDAKRVADVRQLQSALELNYNDWGEYPNTLQMLTPNYLGIVPQAPTPADGTCTPNQNYYIYTPLDNGQSYQITFCLGSDSGGYSSGPQVVNPDAAGPTF